MKVARINILVALLSHIELYHSCLLACFFRALRHGIEKVMVLLMLLSLMVINQVRCFGHKTHWFCDLGTEHLLDSNKYGKSDLMPPSVSVPLIYYTILRCSEMSGK